MEKRKYFKSFFVVNPTAEELVLYIEQGWKTDPVDPEEGHWLIWRVLEDGYEVRSDE